MRRLLPHPLVSLVLAVVWVLLQNDVSAGAAVLGVLLGVLIPQFTRQFWPESPRIRHFGKAAIYTLIVLWDIVVANVEVAYLIVFRPVSRLHPRFFAVPLDLTTPEAITVLAGTVTMTPGTVSSDLSADGRSLLVHGLNVPDEAAAIAQIKQRYEARLKEIFE